MRRLGGITDSVDLSSSKLQEIVKDRTASHAAVHGVTKSHSGLSDFTSLQEIIPSLCTSSKQSEALAYMDVYLHLHEHTH